MATIPRTYIVTKKANLSNIDPKNGQVIAIYDSDEVWYDVPDNGSPNGNPVRRKISGVKVVTSLPTPENVEDYDDTNTYTKGDYCKYSDAFYICNVDSTTGIFTPSAWLSTSTEVPMEDILYVYIGNHGTLPNSQQLYDLRIWFADAWLIVGSNQDDFNVKTEVTEDTFYLAGTSSDTDSIGTLLKNLGVTVSVSDYGNTINADYFNGLASNALHADSASDADKATNDEKNQKITGYVRNITSDYNPSNPFGNTTFSINFGDDTDFPPTTVVARGYNIFNSTTAGLVDAPNDVAPANKLLTNTGWVAKGNIDIGTADVAKKAYGDTDSTRNIAAYFAEADINAAQTKITLTRGNGVTKDINLLSYGVFTTSADGLAPKANVTDYNKKFLRGDAQWVSLPEFDGTNAGVVPITGADATKYLAGDGTWKGAFTSATSSADGTVGLVPAPEDDDVGKVLSNEGWVINGTGASADTNPSNPIYLVGSKARNAGTNITYTQDNVYVAESKIYQSDDSSNPAQVVDVSSTQTLANKQFTIDGNDYALGTACSYPATDDVYPDYEDSFEGDGSKTEFNLTHDAAAITDVQVADQSVTTYSFVECEDYADSILYALDSYCIHEDEQESRNIYRCTTAITTPESWDLSHWTLVVSGIASPDLIVFNTAPASGDSIVVSYTFLATGTIPTSDAVSTFVSESLNTVVGIANNKVNNNIIAPSYDTSSSGYVAANKVFCMYQGVADTYAKLYKCKRDVAQGADFDPADWDEMTVIDAIKWLITS
jgi:hypothetical protein